MSAEIKNTLVRLAEAARRVISVAHESKESLELRDLVGLEDEVKRAETQLRRNPHIHDDTLYAELWYPRIEEVKHVQVGLVDVRAADDIRISYDFDRNGWKIEQDAKGDEPDWQEVAFVKAWGRTKGGVE